MDNPWAAQNARALRARAHAHVRARARARTRTQARACARAGAPLGLDLAQLGGALRRGNTSKTTPTSLQQFQRVIDVSNPFFDLAESMATMDNGLSRKVAANGMVFDFGDDDGDGDPEPQMTEPSASTNVEMGEMGEATNKICFAMVDPHAHRKQVARGARSIKGMTSFVVTLEDCAVEGNLLGENSRSIKIKRAGVVGARGRRIARTEITSSTLGDCPFGIKLVLLFCCFL